MGLLEKFRYRHRFAFVLFIFTLIPFLLLGGFLYKGMREERIQGVLQDYASGLGNYAVAADRLLVACIQKGLYLKSNSRVLSYLSMEGRGDLVSTLDFIDYLQEIINALNADYSSAVIRLYALQNRDNLGEYYKSQDLFWEEFDNKEEVFREQILGLPYDGVLWKSRLVGRDTYSRRKEDYLCVYRTIESINTLVGIVEIGLPVKKLESLLPFSLPEGAFMLLAMAQGEGESTVMALGGTDSPGQEAFAAYAASGQAPGFHILKASLPALEGQIYLFVPDAFVSERIKGGFLPVAAFVLLLLLLLVFAAEGASFGLTRRLSRLMSQMDRDLDDLINQEEMAPYQGRDEIGRIGNKVLGLIQRVKEYYARVSESEARKRVLELELLQERLNPHMLYNTLGTVKSIVKDRRVQMVVDSMVKYYRIALNRGDSIILLSRELDLATEYLKLQKFTYGKDFEILTEADPDTLGCTVIRHLLQPIVENALLHGIGGLPSGGSIKIRTFFEDLEAGNSGRAIRVEIRDNGPGMDPQCLKRLAEDCPPPEEKDCGTGYGIVNVKKRMALHYGPGYGLSIASTPGRGTCVSLRIPFRTK